MNTGGSISFNYTGAYQTFTAPAKGIYKLECWGAQGGTYSETYTGGKGGYSKGVINLEKGDVLYVYVGGQPDPNTSSTRDNPALGGFNGGGTSKTYSYSSATTMAQGGGGATDIRLTVGDLYSRIIVAGGGAGSTSRSVSENYYGGGETSGGYSATYQATQTSAGTNGAFGQGGNATGSANYRYGAPGGGGGWYGGGTSTSVSDSSATYCQYVGGGSGYVLTSTSTKPSGYTPTSKYWMTETQLLAGNQSMPSITGGTKTGNEGNGCVRITLVKRAAPNARCKINGSVKEVSGMKVKVNNSWKDVVQVMVKVNGVWKQS